MSWSIGANDVSNAMGTSVGSGALTMKKAVLIAAVLEFLGAFLLGSNVSQTLQTGLISTHLFESDTDHLIIGMFSALLATASWLQIASFCGWPVSTTHAIVGAIVGFALISKGVDSVAWSKVGSIASSWLLSPLLSGIISYTLFRVIQKTIFSSLTPLHSAKKVIPLLALITLFSFALPLSHSLLARYVTNPSPYLLYFLAGGIGLCGFFSVTLYIKIHTTKHEKQREPSLLQAEHLTAARKALKHLERLQDIPGSDHRASIQMAIKTTTQIRKTLTTPFDGEKNEAIFTSIEHLFVVLQIGTACFVAFGHGANDVANAIGPVASVLHLIVNSASLTHSSTIPTWLLVFGGIGIVTGLATWGWRVIETVGKKITELSPSRGFAAEGGAALTILIASTLGLPISTTHCIVGAVLGVGMAKGISALNLSMVRDVVLSWVITIPSAAIVSVTLYTLLSSLLGSSSLF